MSSTVPVFNTLMLALLLAAVRARGGSFYREVDLTWGGDGRAKILDDGGLLTLSLDRTSGSGFQSKREYLFGKIEMQLKLVPGDSAGTVTAYYLSSSQGPTGHDEIDFEFLGNQSGHPYTLHTNVFTHGNGGREQQFRLWFDPTQDFHTYSILWNPRHIIFAVDGIPIRDFANLERQLGVPFPRTRPMRLYSSLWNADDWATQGGRVKADWSKAPFVASFRGFLAESCPTPPGGRCSGSGAAWWLNQQLDATGRRLLRWVQSKYMIYNYCADTKRFPGGLPPECSSRAATFH